MEAMRESWTDDRLDKLEGRVEERFNQVDECFRRVDERFDQMEERFNQADKRFDRIEGRFNQADKRFDRIEDRFERMENQTNDRLLALHRLIIQVGGGMIATLAAGLLAALATHV